MSNLCRYLLETRQPFDKKRDAKKEPGLTILRVANYSLLPSRRLSTAIPKKTSSAVMLRNARGDIKPGEDDKRRGGTLSRYLHRWCPWCLSTAAANLWHGQTVLVFLAVMVRARHASKGARNAGAHKSWQRLGATKARRGELRSAWVVGDMSMTGSFDRQSRSFSL